MKTSKTESKFKNSPV